MIVCLCNAITERQVEAAIVAGATTAEGIYEFYDGDLQCAKCLPMMQDIVNRHLWGEDEPTLQALAAE